MPTSLDVRDLRKQFATGRPAVDGVSFHVPTGRSCVARTLRLRQDHYAAVRRRPQHSTAGRISIGGRLVSSPVDGVQVPAPLRNIGMVFQSYAVWRI